MQGTKEGRNGEWLLNWYGVSFWSNANIQELDSGDGIQLCEFIKCHWAVHSAMTKMLYAFHHKIIIIIGGKNKTECKGNIAKNIDGREVWKRNK